MPNSSRKSAPLAVTIHLILLEELSVYSDQAQARRDKNKEARKRREERQHAKRTELLRKISESERTAIAEQK